MRTSLIVLLASVNVAQAATHEDRMIAGCNSSADLARDMLILRYDGVTREETFRRLMDGISDSPDASKTRLAEVYNALLNATYLVELSNREKQLVTFRRQMFVGCLEGAK